MNQSEDISKILISEDVIRQKLPSIFIDSIITDNELKITVVSQNILDLLEFKLDELKGKPLHYLFEGNEFESNVLNKEGHFDEHPVCLISKSQKKITFGISGFYLGLVSELNDRVIFTVRCLEQSESKINELQERKAEIDKFIYRAGHDLRGPLATIKGLVNLLKIRTNNDELDRLIQLIDAHTNTLDERLFQLAYTTADTEINSTIDLQSATVLETRLRQIIERNAFVDFLELQFTSTESRIKGINPLLFCGLLENILLYILALPMNSVHSHIYYRITIKPGGIQVTVEFVGFEMNDVVVEALKLPDFNYTDLVKYPHMINFYTAQRKAEQLQGKVKATILSSSINRIEAFLPTFH